MRWRATYRLQLRQGLDLEGARALVPQLAALGISHVYLSPILRARRGSPHGYDGVDPTVVDPALGGEAALERLLAALRRHHMGVLLDVVPNHLAAEPEQNPFFDDVLMHGPASRFADWFDVDWGAPGRERHTPWLLPLLGSPLAEALGRGELALERSGARFRVRYFERRFPVDPASLILVLEPACRALERSGARRPARGLAALLTRMRALPSRTCRDPRSRRARHAARVELERVLAARLRASPDLRRAVDAALAALHVGARAALARFLDAQAWRLGYWRSARRCLNHRRFFDVSELVGIRCEDPAVFDATHAKVLDLVERRLVDGLRIDHVDGLLRPGVYLRRLRRAVRARLPTRENERFPILVEKILASGEALPPGWAVEGTTGYEFLNELEATLLDPAGAREVERVWSRLTRLPADFPETARRSKRRVLESLLFAELDRLAARLSPGPRERVALRQAVRELIVHLPVYRTYARRGCALSATDRRLLAQALRGARREGRVSRAALGRLDRALHADAGDGASRGDPGFLERLQQLSGPAAAKGVEDTAFYVHVPLLSRNEVGGDPGEDLGEALPRFHAACAERARRWPGTLLAATTHDTKRSADVRARLDVLSELPDAWAGALARWRERNRPLQRRVGGRPVPDPNTEYLLYQTLVGVWPHAPGASLPPAAQRGRLRERVADYLEKASREAKVRTRWIAPDPLFERGLSGFVGDLLGEAGLRSGFLEDLATFVAEVARPGLWNSLARTLVQLAAPGLPDVYQGDALFSFSLVDPDNRRPVEFSRRRRLLGSLQARFERTPAARATLLRELVARPEDGRIKLHVMRTALATRRRIDAPFATGAHLPLAARGPAAAHVLAFARRAGDAWAVAVAPRLPRTLVGDGRRAPVGAAVWGETALCLPRPLAGRRLASALCGVRLEVPDAASPTLPLARVLEELPVALLVARGRPGHR